MKGTSGRVRMHTLRAALFVGLIGTTASADVWVTGAICTESAASAGNVFDKGGGWVSNPTSGVVGAACPIPVDQNLGTTHSFEMRVDDNDATLNFTSCIGLVIGTDGEILASTNSDSTSGQLEDTLTFSTTTGASSDDYSYVVICSVPGNNSYIENLRIY